MTYDFDNPDADQSSSIGEAVEYLKRKPRRIPAPLPRGAYSVAEAAALLGLSTKTVIRKFRNIEGVVNHGSKRKGMKQARSRITIPTKVMEEYLTRQSVKGA
jgi:hypothetical protein